MVFDIIGFYQKCVIPENIQTPPTEGCSDMTPHPLWNFRFGGLLVTPHPLWNFQAWTDYPPPPSGNLEQKKKRLGTMFTPKYAQCTITAVLDLEWLKTLTKILKKKNLGMKSQPRCWKKDKEKVGLQI